MVQSWVGVRPAHERVDRLRLPLVMPRVEALQVAASLGLGAGQRDLRHLAHLRRPATERFHELAQRQAAGRLRPKAVLMGLLHGPVY